MFDTSNPKAGIPLRAIVEGHYQVRGRMALRIEELDKKCVEYEERIKALTEEVKQLKEGR